MKICINYSIRLFDILEKKVLKILERFGREDTHTIWKLKFKDAIESLTRTTINNWKINEMFTTALRSGELNFIGKEEFIEYALNTNEIISPMIAHYLSETKI